MLHHIEGAIGTWISYWQLRYLTHASEDFKGKYHKASTSKMLLEIGTMSVDNKYVLAFLSLHLCIHTYILYFEDF